MSGGGLVQGTATATGDPEQDRAKAASLGNAVLVMTMLPWTLCVLIYTAIHFTYRRDKLRAMCLEQQDEVAEQALLPAPASEPVEEDASERSSEVSTILKRTWHSTV